VTTVRQSEAPVKRSRIAIVIAVLVIAIALLHLLQAINGVIGGGDPQMLVLEHLDVTIFSLIAAYAIWTGKRWAPWALAVAGVAVAVLIASLGPLLNMNAVERRGLWTGAGSMLVFTALGVWYLARRVKPQLSS